MSKVMQAFEHGKAFIAFVTGGDPDLNTTEQLIYAMEEAGADLIEIGVPFSDPIAEGEVIQAANERSLAAGCTTDALFDMINRTKGRVNVPLVLLTYLNPVYTYGKEQFLKCCREVGVSGLIVPDLPFEEKEELSQVCEAYEVDLISLIAPTSKERTAMIAREAKGFVYCVSSLGVTGVRSSITTNLEEMITSIREVTSVPCAIGFGISTKEQAGRMARLADGVIVGSAIVKLIAEYGRNSVSLVKEYVKRMKAGIASE